MSSLHSQNPHHLNLPERGEARILIVAHYHRDGKLRSDTAKLLEDAPAFFERVILVSTHLSLEAQAAIPSGVEVIVRPNEGYDFYSYRAALLRLWGLDGDELPAHHYDSITLMNTSILIVNPDQLWSTYFARWDAVNAGGAAGMAQAFGLTLSDNNYLHLQSYLLSFTKDIADKEVFRKWWQEMTPINTRAEVITQFEFGLSKLLQSLGVVLYAAFDASWWQKNNQGIRQLKKMVLEGLQGKKQTSEKTLLDIEARKNPTHGQAQQIFEEFGVLKVEIVQLNPLGLALNWLECAKISKPRLAELTQEALHN